MGKIHAQQNWVIRVQGNEHPPVHVHVIHPDGKAIVYLNGDVTNSSIPADVLKTAKAWVDANVDIIRAEWARMNNPTTR
ncbi:MAG: DUF4160 domain-containing protein [Azonexus sp.]|jgi:hypothetical protein|nr:DUF4160 domain-containing protein [Azonexus sp.]